MPLDYLVSCQVSNATLTLTNGVAIGYFDSQGIGLNNWRAAGLPRRPQPAKCH